jgi:Tetratricopeptide repeat
MLSPPAHDSALPDTKGEYATQPAITGRLSSGAENLLIGISVYREPADRNAILFQLGVHDWSAAREPGQCGPVPPYQQPPDLPELITACVAADLVTAVPTTGPVPAYCWLVDTVTAARFHQELSDAGRGAELVAAHRRAAGYWQWRAAAWPQDREADLHDLFEARHHRFSAGEAGQASDITREICAQLHAWGDLAREAELICSTLDLLPGRSSGQAAGWLHELGAIFQISGNLSEAQRCYAASVELFTIHGDFAGVARSRHSLGVLAQAQGDYRRAERQYRRSAAAEKKARGTAPGGTTGPATGTAGAAGGAASAGGTAGTADAVSDSAAGGTAGPATGDSARGTAGPATGDSARGTADPAASAAMGAGAAGGRSRSAAPPRGAGSRPSPWTRAPGWLTSPASLRAAFRQAGRTLRQRPVLILAVVGWLLVALSVAGIAVALARTASATQTSRAAAVRAAAASWVAGQVSRSAVIGCDPAMCAALQQHGVPAGELLSLGSAGPPDPLASDVIIATAAVRSEFGTRLASVYAPLVIASFGTGTASIQVRAIAPDGAPAYARAMRSDLAGRRRLGADLLQNTNLLAPARAQTQLAAGNVDARLLATLATLADLQPLRVIAFSDAGPGADPAVPMRAAEIAAATPGDTSWIASARAFLTAQQAPFRPSEVVPARLPGHRQALLVEYSGPSPMGLLSASGTASGASVRS